MYHSMLYLMFYCINRYFHHIAKTNYHTYHLPIVWDIGFRINILSKSFQIHSEADRHYSKTHQNTTNTCLGIREAASVIALATVSALPMSSSVFLYVRMVKNQYVSSKGLLCQ